MICVRTVIVSALLLNACAAPVIAPGTSSKNVVSGSGESYICPLSDGAVELKLSAAALPTCTKLSELPPEDAKAIEEKVAEQNSNIIAPGTISILRQGI